MRDSPCLRVGAFSLVNKVSGVSRPNGLALGHSRTYSEAMTTNKVSHRVSWYVYVDGQRIRRTASMRGAWAYDVECSCGWYTRTGGAVKSYVDSLVWEHKHGFGNDNYSI